MGKDIELSLDIAMGNLGWVCFKDSVPQACGVVSPSIPKDLASLKGKKKLSVREQNVILLEQLIDGFDRVLVRHHPALVVGEAPPGGAQDANAAVKLNMALAVVVTVCFVHGVPYQWCSPLDVKRATAGADTASKEQIMDWALDRFGGEKDVQEVLIKNGKCAGKVTRRLKYNFLGRWIPGGKFEHIADACGAYVAVKNQPTSRPGARGYRNKPRRLGQ